MLVDGVDEAGGADSASTSKYSDWEHDLISVVRLRKLAVPCTAGAGMAE